ncbi:hypothetical protein KsCSTR_07120 [Candidatus Kuenenia stuttgartiensis]|uniref:Uncharacterized protein n=1 Tax=Kuenenia stuttgartiensis TaxID=174633 RepID=A0A6G7GKZ4_KUEST|nr:hypothetical protein KsCSTR_07120 [Candidatus Kuenenia stuttgartiensis]
MDMATVVVICPRNRQLGYEYIYNNLWQMLRPDINLTLR